ncbi:MAG: hypothetical protein ACRC3Y_10590 [Romboutsia sp.]|uniref:hypothetical protein n=1 Tax=Romboutsia sp. TaxID=1965302 RepID=UPI003F3CF01A
MNKGNFNKLDIISKIEYFNTKLNEGQTVIRIREDIGLSEKGWQKEAKCNGYKYDTKLRNYIKVTDVLSVNDIQGDDSNHNVVVSIEDYKKVIEELQEIKNMYRKFEDVYNWYELQKNVVEKEHLRVEANDNEIVTRSFKIYGDIYKDFIEFCNDHKEYKVQQIVSQALKELVEKYK